MTWMFCVLRDTLGIIRVYIITKKNNGSEIQFQILVRVHG